MKKALIYLLTLMAFVACNNSVTPDDPTPEPPVSENEILIEVDQERLTAYQVIYSIYPKDQERYFYCDVMSKARWESANIEEVKAEFDAALRNYAQMTESSYEEVCEQMLFKGNQENFLSNAGYRENTDFVIFAFYWDENEFVEEVFFTEFRTPAHVDSTESVAIAFDGVDPYEMTATCTPSEGVQEYYYYFAETAKVEAMLAQLEDKNAYMSYQAMNVSMKYSGEQTLAQKGLKPETSYTALVMLIDKQGNRAGRCHFWVREGKAWGVQVITRIYQRKTDTGIASH